MHKIEQSGGFLGRQLGPILKTGLLLMKNVLNTLVNFFDSIRITAAASAPDAAIHKKMFESTVKTLITSNEEMNDIMKIVKSLEESGLFIQLKMKQKNERRTSQYMIRYIRCYFIRKFVTGKGKIRAGEAQLQQLLYLTVKYKSIIKMNLNIMIFTQGVIYLK